MTQNLKDEYPVCRTCGTLFLYTGGERRHTLAEGKARDLIGVLPAGRWSD